MELGLSGIGVRFGRSWALRNVTLDFPAGSQVGVCGGPGAGKTTLLKVLAGLRRPDEGTVHWDREDVWELPVETRRARQAAFGMVFQSDALFDSETVLKNVRLPLVNRGLPEAEANARAREVLRAVGIGDAADLLPAALSGGMRKRAGIARAVAARPEVLLADDPIAGLDPSTASQVIGVLREVSRERTLIVAVPEPVASLELGRWILLERGEVAYDGSFDACLRSSRS